jgi:hypothetical protein
VGTKGNGILKIYDYEFDKNISDCRAEVLTTSNSALSSNAFIVLPEPPEFALDRRRRRLTYYSYREKVFSVYRYGSVTKIFKYIHDIYETADYELMGWRVSAWEW